MQVQTAFFHKQLLADLAGEGEKLIADARTFGQKRYGVDFDDLDATEKLMVVLAAIQLRRSIA